MSRLAKIVFALSGIIALPFAIVPNPLTLYPIFVLVYFFREKINFSAKFWFPYVMLICLSLEFLAWLGSFIEQNPEPALFHPQLIPDLLLGIGFYSGWVLAWWLILRRWSFSILEVFVLQGLYGVVVEQDGAILLLGISQFPLGMVFWVYVFLVYGSTMALAFLPFRASFPNQKSSLWKYPALLLLMVLFVYIFFYVFALLWTALGLIPEAGSIVERPFF
jgi:hypothetical protein